jgi:hypothetical protein
VTETEEFRLDEWLAEGVKGLRSIVSGTRVLPEAFWEHSRAAGRESLLAVRSLLDAVIAQTERAPKRVTKIKAEKAD